MDQCVLRLNRPECHLPMCAVWCGAYNGCLCAGPTGSSGAARPGQRMSVQVQKGKFAKFGCSHSARDVEGAPMAIAVRPREPLANNTTISQRQVSVWTCRSAK